MHKARAVAVAFVWSIARIKRRHWRRGVAATLLLVVSASLILRFGAETPAGQALVIAPLNGLSLGSVGRLHIEGVKGDVWRDFTIGRAYIADEQGAWIDLRQVHVRWRWFDLLRRRLHLTHFDAASIQILRRPTVQSNGPPSKPPVSLLIDSLNTRLETASAFSVARGDFQTSGRLTLERSGSVNGALSLVSLLHQGDGLNARFAVGRHQRLLLDAQAYEERGGALAGALGLPATQSFRLEAQTTGYAKAGQFRLRAWTGPRAVARADGTWTKAGGAGTGVLSLSDSTLTARWMHALGPQIALSAQSRGQDLGRYVIGLQAKADNAELAASGVVSWPAQATYAPLHVTARVRDMSRLVAFPAIGAAALDAAVSGTPSDWRMSGKASAQHVALYGYTLGQAEGMFTLTLAKHETRLTTNLKGAGGEGQGLLASAAGARPTLTADISRRSDGQLVLRALQAQGDGLKLEATGQRGLFGGVALKGTLRLSNLAAARKGARGEVDVRWTAEQHKDKEPWSVGLDAQADHFASGWADLDRFLGVKPKLNAEALWAPDDLRLAKLDLHGAAGEVHSSGVIGKDAALDLALKWSARGPMTLGPLAISGDASGSGTLKGPISAVHADLQSQFQRLDAPNLPLKDAHVALAMTRTTTGFDGQIALTAASDNGPAHARARFHSEGDDMAFSDLDAAGGGATAAGALTLRRLSPASAELTITVGPGAFASQGHAEARLTVVDAVAALHLTMRDFILLSRVQNGASTMLRNAGLSVSQAEITAKGPLSKLPYTIDGEAVAAGQPVRLKGGGVASKSEAGYAVSFDGAGRLRGADFHTQTPALITFGGADLSGKFNLLLGGGQMTLDARQSGDAMSADLGMNNVSLDTLDPDMTGRMSGTLSLKGRGKSLDGVLTARLDGARSRDASAKVGLSGDVRAVLSNTLLIIDSTAHGAQPGDKATLKLSIPAEAEASPFRIALNRVKPISGHVDVTGELQPIWDLFFAGDRELGGRLTGQAEIGGSLNAPRLNGDASLVQGRFEDAATGLKLRNLSADVTLRGAALTVRQFSANDAGGGTISGAGGANFEKGGASTLTLKAKGFKLLDNDTAKATASGDVNVVSDAEGRAKLTGSLVIDRADISTVSSRRPTGVVTLDVTERNAPVGFEHSGPIGVAHIPQVALDIAVRAPGKIYVKGLGLNAEMSLAATVTGSTAAPDLQGVAHVVRGDYDLGGKRFQIDDSGTVRLASSPDKMRLDLKATLDQTSITAVINIGGTAAKPDISLTSTPTLPSDEVLSQVLFGRSAAQLSPVEAAQLAASVASLATGGGFDVMGGLRNFARLDRLALGGGDTTSTSTTTTASASNVVTVSGGKYIGEKVYVELTGGGRQGPSAQVEVRATRALSVISQVGGETGAKLAVRWKFNYGKPKKDKKDK